MADNPLYPGTIPKGNAYNPLYPGYYPGQPIPKRPKPSSFIKPIQFNPMAFSQLIDEEEIIAGPLKGPAWLKERIVEDWKQQMQVQVFGGQVDQSEIGDYDTDTLPGASGTGITLDPEKWKDPKKVFKDTAVSWIKTATGIDVTDLTKSNFGDFEARVRAGIWENALGFDVSERADIVAKGMGPDKLKVAAAEALGETTLERNRPSREAPMSAGMKQVLEPGETAGNFHALNINPMKVTISETVDDGNGGSRIIKKTLVESGKYDDPLYKGYSELGKSVKNFELNQNNAFFRDSNYTGVLRSALGALDTDLYGKAVDITEERNRDKYKDIYEQRVKSVQTGQAVSDSTPIQPITSTITSPDLGKAPRVVVSSDTPAAPVASTTPQINKYVGSRAEEILARAKAQGVSDNEINIMRDTIDKLHAQKVISSGMKNLNEASEGFVDKGIGAINLGNPRAAGKVTSSYTNLNKNLQESLSQIEEYGKRTGIDVSEYRTYVDNYTKLLDKKITSNADGLASRLGDYRPKLVQTTSIDEDFYRLVTGSEISEDRVATWAKRSGNKTLTKQEAILLDLGIKKNFAEHLDNIDSNIEAFNKAVAGAKGKIGDKGIKDSFDSLVSAQNAARNDLKLLASRQFPGLREEEAIKQLLAGNAGLKSYHEMLDSLDKTLSGHISSDALMFHTSLKTVNGGGIAARGLSKGTLFQSNIERKFLQESMEKGLAIAGGPGGSLENIGSVICHFGLDPNDPNLALKTRAIVKRLQVERSSNAIAEAMNTLQKSPEQFITNYFYNPYIKPRIENFTPAVVTQRLLSRTHYLGLRVSMDYVTDAQRNSALFNKLYANKFKLKVDGVSYTFLAGDHFSSITEIHNFLLTNHGMAKELLEGKKLIDLAEKFNLKMSDADILKMQKGIDKFLDWAKNQSKVSGAKFNDSGFLLNLIKGLNRKSNDASVMGIGITKQYVGGIERVFMSLNRIQKYILNSKVGKLLSKYYNVAKLIAEKVAKLAAKWIAKGITWILGRLADAASMGSLAWLTPILEKVVEPIIRFFIDKTVGYTKAMLAGFIKGDWTAIVTVIEKDVQKTVKFVLLGIGIPMGVLLFAVMAFSMVISGVISPLNPFKSNGGYGAGGMGWPPGENAVVRITKDVEVTAGGTTYTNPVRGTITNDMADAGITVVYKVRITPKITITDGSVRWFDMATARSTTTSFSVMNRPETVLNPFIEGETYEFILPDSQTNPSGTLRLQGSEYHDSMVTNIAAVNTPAVPSHGVDSPDVVAIARSFTIGDYVPDCPLGLAPEGYQIMTTSYRGSYGHGSDGYWDGICNGATDPEACRCNFPIPWVWYRNSCTTAQYSCSPTEPENGCTSKYPSNATPYYGFALDVSPTNPNNTMTYEVTLPTVSPSWVLLECPIPNYGGSWGNGQIWASTDGLWKLYFTHLAATCPGGAGTEVAGGRPIGTLYTGWDSSQLHVHIELIALREGTPCATPEQNGCGRPKRPECYMCAEGGGAECN